MTHYEKVDLTTFAGRFTHFMQVRNLNSNKIATAMKDNNPVKYRRWASGEAMPKTHTLQPVCDKYRVSLDWLLLGQGEMDAPGFVKPQGDHPTDSDGIDWKGKYIELQERFTEAEVQINVLMERVNHLTKHNQIMEYMYQKMDPSFISAGSQSTAMAEFEQLYIAYRNSVQVEGYKRYPQAESGTPIRPLVTNPETIIRELWNTTTEKVCA